MTEIEYRARLSDFLIINIPSFLLLLLIPAGYISYLSLRGYWKLAIIPLTVWGLSGALLLLRDYFKRKRPLFLRLLRLNEGRDPLKHSMYLRSTVCGLAILWALHVRLKKHRRSLHERTL